MTKDDLVLLIHERTGFSKVESAEILEEILNLLKERLADGDHVKLSGFGKFQVSHKRARKGRSRIRRSCPSTTSPCSPTAAPSSRCSA